MCIQGYRLIVFINFYGVSNANLNFSVENPEDFKNGPMKIMKFGQIIFLSKTQVFFGVSIYYLYKWKHGYVHLEFPKLGLRKEHQTKVTNSPHNIKTFYKECPCKIGQFQTQRHFSCIFFASLVLVWCLVDLEPFSLLDNWLPICFGCDENVWKKFQEYSPEWWFNDNLPWYNPPWNPNNNKSKKAILVGGFNPSEKY